MPFSKTNKKHSEDYWTGFFNIICTIMQKHNYECKKSEIGPYNIFSQIVENIETADIVIAVLTDYNANVWYELGVRHTLKNGTIMLLQKGQKVPFDVEGYGVILYNDSYAMKDSLEREISNYIRKLTCDACDSPVLHSLTTKSVKSIEKNIDKMEKRLEKKLVDLIWEIVNSDRTENIFERKEIIKRNKILWVDDYPSNNSAIMSLFEEKKVYFDIALTTEHGIRLFNNQSYDIIITDIGRQNEHDAGIKFIDELKKLQCETPILVYSSYNNIKKYEKKALEYGASKVSCNPYDIIVTISNILGL